MPPASVGADSRSTAETAAAPGKEERDHDPKCDEQFPHHDPVMPMRRHPLQRRREEGDVAERIHHEGTA